MITFSIIIPTHNRANIISYTLDSVATQTFDNWECLIIDDNSNDNTKVVVDYYCKKDSRFKYLSNENVRGAQGARNTGISHASGLFISFLDSDDRWHPNMLEKQYRKYTSDPSISCVYSKIQTIINLEEKQPWKIYKGLQGTIYKEVLIQGYMTPTSTLSAKKECFEMVGVFDTSLPACQDDDMCFRLAKKYKIGFIPDILTDYYKNTDNRISDNIGKVSMGWWILWNKYEADVINYCGKDVIAKHYKECLHHFIQANNVRMSWKAYKKFLKFGGNLSKRKTLWFMAYILSFGKNRHITQKTQNKI